MISPCWTIDQVMRLSNLKYFPHGNDGAIQELVKPLLKASSEVVVVSVIEEWIKNSTERPTPADFYRAVERHNRMQWNHSAGVCFNDWNVAFGTGNYDADFDAFLEWVMSGKPWPARQAHA